MVIQDESIVENTYKLAIKQGYQALNTEAPDAKKKARSELIESLAQYGHYLYKDNQYTSAQKYYLQALKLDPDHLIALNQMGMCLSKTTHFSQARDYFSEIIERTEIVQERADAWLNIACTHRLQHNWQKAAKALREAKLLAPRDQDILNEEKMLRDLVSSTVFSTSNARVLFNKQEKNTYNEKESVTESILEPA